MSTAYPQVGGYPAPQYAPPAYRLYDVWAVAIAAFFGGPLAGTVLDRFELPQARPRQQRSSRARAGSGGVWSVGVIYMAVKTTANPAIAEVVLLVCTVLAAKQLQDDAIKTHVAWGGQLYSKLARFRCCYRDGDLFSAARWLVTSSTPDNGRVSPRAME